METLISHLIKWLLKYFVYGTISTSLQTGIFAKKLLYLAACVVFDLCDFVFVY